MTTKSPQIRHPMAGVIDIDRHRDHAWSLRSRHACDMMRGAVATIWTLAAAAVLLLAVVAFAPRNSVTAEVAWGGDQVSIAAWTR
jgi:hypothetical protein